MLILDALLAKIASYNPQADLGMVGRAYEYSARVHEGQKRVSGEPYLTHPLAVADIIADMRLDVASVVTGLLHDTVEDTLATLDDIRENFGEEVAGLVDGVTKISRLESQSRAAAEAETLRKMFLASARDIRVLLVKLADRAHNVRTLHYLDESRRTRIAKETIELYAPLAHRMGVNWLKSEFEETGFATLWPDQCAEIREKLSLHRLEREGYIKEISGVLVKRLQEAGLQAEVQGRTKGAYSIFRKMTQQGLQHDEVYDVVAFRVLVDSDRECYDALGIVHGNWRPVPGRFRDYIALPKANRYQSLHSTVIGPYGERMEIQIRTHGMHRIADFGVAAHWKYKTEESEAESERFAWLKQILEWQQHFDDPQEFLTSLKDDLFAEEVVVFTPTGEKVLVRNGETVVDFAYRIHSEVGAHCAGARVNGKLVPLRYQPQQGDTVEVVTTEDARPAREWLKFVRTPRARARILASIRQEERDNAIALGSELLERDLARWDLDLAGLRSEGRMEGLSKEFNRKDEASFLEAIGYGRVTTRQVLAFLLPDENFEEGKGRRRFPRLFRLLDRGPKPMVMGENIDEALVRFGKCCQPLYGENIVGFITRGRGVTVHLSKCPRLVDTDPERLVAVHWRKGSKAMRLIRLEVTSRDRPALLANMGQAIASGGANIEAAHISTEDAKATNIFDVSLDSAAELARVVSNLRRIPGVKAVKRVFS